MDKIERQRAVENASEDVTLLVESGFLDHGADWIRAWHSHDLKWSDSNSGFVTIPEKEVMPFVSRARRNSEVFALLKYVAGTRLAQNAPLPSEMRSLVANYLIGDFMDPI